MRFYLTYLFALITFGALHGDTLYLAGSDYYNQATLWTASFDQSNNPNFTLLNLDTPGSNAFSIALSSTQAYIVGNDASFSPLLWVKPLLSESSFSSIKLDNSLSTATSIALSSTHAYIIGADDSFNLKLWTISLSDPASSISSFTLNSTAGLPNSIALSSTHAYVAGANDTGAVLWIIDLSDPTSSVLPIELEIGDGRALSIALSQNTIYIAGFLEFEEYLWTLPLSNPTAISAPFKTSDSYINNYAPLVLSSRQIYIGGNNADDNATVWEIPISDPTTINRTLNLSDNTETASETAALALSSNRLFSVEVHGIYDLSVFSLSSTLLSNSTTTNLGNIPNAFGQYSSINSMAISPSSSRLGKLLYQYGNISPQK